MWKIGLFNVKWILKDKKEGITISQKNLIELSYIGNILMHFILNPLI
jgi:hypothetical protein